MAQKRAAAPKRPRFHRQDIQHILDELERAYPDVRSGLDFTNAFELLISTILAAQCTDVRVNSVAAPMFVQYPRPEDYVDMPLETLEQIIKPCGFYHNKAKNIIAACTMLVEEYGSAVPDSLDALQRLPGVGRKTANVVVSNAFGQAAIAVDTHVFRVSNRLGLADAANVERTEEQLMRNIPKEKWSDAHHWLIWHGRRVCAARKPKCDICTLTPWCKHYRQQSKEK
ncbi:endonuclease III [Bacteroidia bacterium]|nr:endonuclease III [Bacteroidia bacterium]